MMFLLDLLARKLDEKDRVKWAENISLCQTMASLTPDCSYSWDYSQSQNLALPKWRREYYHRRIIGV